ncbi:hypothetical protein AEAC466_09405 [Asticcacaulis sp. AC466]|uniref:tRNA (5-methylaminomethyl-2-thiouridine)(34)-methyltransferase MnmD n=1 Tax=Asticcacaulis sp. AC466 TaxID=1282362 RepID=UPI0003C3DF8E|nr:tRNA (5-methylaminomethyl-2-thiouridine)(34)-methyltransferase MnmD [Asticcacaulis sp. AC466]ESQ84558.1 hypothetical protein AEAC466_09405 [Asticcacaulis sp. AC466]
MINDANPELYFAEDGAPRSGRFGDIYYSLQDGLSETRAVFLAGCNMPEMWRGRGGISLLELGFGTGLNIAAVMQLWARTREPGAHLHIFSIEGFIMSAQEAGQALRNWPELAEMTDALLAQWPKSRRGFHYMDFPQWGVSLTLGLMDVRAALTAWQGMADAVFLDGFSPALNPDMWADDVFAQIAAKTRAGAPLATFTVAGFVRRGLQAAGFSVEKKPGFGRKRERLEAIRTGEVAVRPARPHKIAVIGAGISGCALVYQARLLGIGVDLFEAGNPGAGASGNEGALVTPRLDAGANAISDLYADAFAYAGALYRRLCPEAILSEGAHQYEATDRDASRFARIVTQTGFADGDLRLFSAGEAIDGPTSSGIYIATALSVQPRTVLDALLAGQQPVQVRVTGVTPSTVQGEDGDFTGYDAVILACGEGMLDLAGEGVRLQPVRGQVECVALTDGPGGAISWGGYALPLADGVLFGATHVRDDRGSDIRAEDRALNIANLAKVIPAGAAMAEHLPSRSRASVRVTTPDYLPVAGQAESGVWLLTGLGARGFCLAPLLAKAVMTQILCKTFALQRQTERLIDCRRSSV